MKKQLRNLKLKDLKLILKQTPSDILGFLVGETSLNELDVDDSDQYLNKLSSMMGNMFMNSLSNFALFSPSQKPVASYDMVKKLGDLGFTFGSIISQEVNSQSQKDGKTIENIGEITQEMIDKFLNDPNRNIPLVEKLAREQGLPIDKVGDFLNTPGLNGRIDNFHKDLLSKLSNLIRSKTGRNVHPNSLLYKIIGTGTELEQKLFQQHRSNPEQVVLFLELMCKIQNKKGYFQGIKTDPTTFQEIKNEMIAVCYDYIIEKNLIPFESIELFDLYFSIAFVISEIENDLKNFNEVNDFIKEELGFDIINKILNRESPNIEEMVRMAEFLFDYKNKHELISNTLRKLYAYYNAYQTIKDYELLKLISVSITQDSLLKDDIYIEQLEIYYFKNLIQNLLDAEVKITPEEVVGILKEQGGYTPIRDNKGKIIGWSEVNKDKIVWLELGNIRAGIIHILLRHKNDFANKDIKSNLEIAKTILRTIQGKSYVKFEDSQIYKVTNDAGEFIMYLKVIIGPNGFIVTAYPNNAKDLPNWVIDKLDELENTNK